MASVTFLLLRRPNLELRPLLQHLLELLHSYKVHVYVQQIRRLQMTVLLKRQAPYIRLRLCPAV